MSGPDVDVTTSRNAATCGPEHELRHAVAGDRHRLRDAVGACPLELPRGVGVGGARDDQQVGPDRARGDGDEEVVRVVARRGDETARLLDACRLEILVLRARAVDPRRVVFARCGKSLRIGVEDDVRHAGASELGRHGLANATVAADDVVVAQALDHFQSPPIAPRRP